MAFPDVLPPADLLQRVSGVEQGLRQRRRLSLVGLVALAVQGTLLVASSDWWSALTSADWAELRQQWPVLLVLLLAVLTLLLIVAMRFWLKESRQPFRYTYSVGNFEPVLVGEDGRLSWLRYDLTERLSVRIGRLSLRQDASTASAADGASSAEPANGAAPLDSHIHITGYYLIRRKPDDPRWVVEVTPWVRIGPPGSPATLAIPVKHYLDPDGGTPKSPDDKGPPDDQVPPVKAQEYEQILEWTYFSVATQIYKRIREDVQRKIELLPSNRFRAAAYLYEADDYARSNTLDAYVDAAQLYDRALKLYDPSMRPLSSFPPRWAGQQVIRALAWSRRTIRRWSSHLWPRLGKPEVMQARARIGYVNMLVNRRTLAAMSGRGATSIFEARPVAERAVDRLTLLSEEVPERSVALFDARVALARVWDEVGSVDRARRQLRAARRLDPARSNQDVGYALALGKVEARPRSRLLHYRRAVELDGQSELARFDLAAQAEMIWRQDQLEPALARAIFDEYKRILRLNPGNIAAWANVGYMHWLLAPRSHAEDPMQPADDAFKRGRDYRDIKGETFVGELDYGLARIAAEQGYFNDAYSSFTSAFSAYCAPGTDIKASPSTYYFSYIGDAIWKRMEKYVKHVRAFYEDPSKLRDKIRATPRVCDAVLAFVLNDFGEACYSRYLRTGDGRLRDQARSLYKEASRHSADYAMPSFNLYRLDERDRYTVSPQGDEEQIRQLMQDALAQKPFQDDKEGHIERVIQLQPEWQDANLAMLSKHATIARRETEAAKRLERDRLRQRQAARRRSADPEQRSGGDYGRQSDWQLWRATAPDRDRDTTREDQNYRTAIRDLRSDARRHHDRATRVLADLLPHAWLWRKGGSLEHQQFNLRALRQRGLARELRWEREFDDLHAEALYTWGETLLLSPDGGGLVGRILDWRSYGWPRPSQALRVFGSIQRHFMPELFTMLLHLRERTNRPGQVQDYNKRIRQAIRRDLAGDPASFDMLAWANDIFVQPVGRSGRRVYRQTFGLAQRSQIFCSAAAIQGLTPSLYEWIGDRLLEVTSELESLAKIVERLWEGERKLLDMGADEIFYALGLIDCHLDFEKIQRDLAGDRLPRVMRVGTALADRTAVFGRLAARLRSRQDTRLAQVADALRAELRQVNVENLRQAAEHVYQEAVERTRDPQRLCRLGAGLAKLGSWPSSFTSYRRARKLLQHAPDVEQRGHLDLAWHGIGRALWALKRHSWALRALDQIVEIPGVLDIGWRSSFVESVRDEQQIDSRGCDALLRAWLEREQSGATMRGEAARRDAGLALLTLATARRRADRFEPVPAEDATALPTLLPVLTPIRLQAEEKLFPRGADTIQVQRMLSEGIPELQRRIRDGTGLRLPGVQIAADSNLTGGQYWVLLHEVVLARGAVHDDDLFDRTMLQDLEGVVRRYLDTFVGLHEASQMVGEWKWGESLPDNGRAELAERALSPVRSMVCFVGVLQRLVREQVPVSDPGPLLGILAQIDWNSPDWSVDGEEAAARVVEEVRLNGFREQLPGNRPGVRLLRLRAEVENDIRRWVQERDGKRFLAIPRNDTATLARVVGALVEGVPSGPDSGVALVVRDAKLRRFVRRLVERDLPFLPVLAEREVLNSDAETGPAPTEVARPGLDSLSTLIGAPP